MSAAAVDRSLAALRAELVRVGAPPPAPSTVDPKVIDEVESAIAPLRLPAGVRRLWETVDPGSIGIDFDTALQGPASNLSTWRQDAEEAPGLCPRALFPIGYQSWSHLSVELHDADVDDGGPLFAWSYGGEDYKLVFAGIADYLDELTRALREGRYERNEHTLWVAHESLEVVGGPRPVIHPVFGPLDAIPFDIDRWPEQWRLKSGIGAAELTPVGANRTIAEFLLETQFGPVEARVHGTVDELAGSLQGIHVTISDDSDSMRVWCPAAITALGPGLGSSYEFHVSAPPTDAPQQPDYHPLRSDPTLNALPINIDHVVDRLTAATRPVDATARKVIPLRS